MSQPTVKDLDQQLWLNLQRVASTYRYDEADLELLRQTCRKFARAVTLPELSIARSRSELGTEELSLRFVAMAGPRQMVAVTSGDPYLTVVTRSVPTNGDIAELAAVAIQMDARRSHATVCGLYMPPYMGSPLREPSDRPWFVRYALA